MTTRNKKARTMYNFTYPGMVAFYESMDGTYLAKLYHKLADYHGTYIKQLGKPQTDEMRAWLEREAEVTSRKMLTIQQVLNARLTHRND